MKNENTGRVGIVIYGYGLGNSPSLINAGKFLASNGYHVDYFTYNTFVGNLEFNDPKINIYELGSNNIANFDNYRIYKSLLPSRFVKLMGIVSRQLLNIKNTIHDKLFYSRRTTSFEGEFLSDIGIFVNRVKEFIKDKKINYLFGVEPGGLIAACLISEAHHIPVIYYSLELLLSNEIKDIRQSQIKNFEKRYNKLADLTISLDKDRVRLLSNDNDVPLDRFIEVPVCADGPRYDERSNWFRDKFNLPDDARIILHAGFISEWGMCEEIAKEALKWPKNYVLILHSHGYEDNKYINKIREYECDNIKISLESVNYDKVPLMLSSADIGIALYKNINKNFTLISSASGKLSHYLKCGLPVIVNNYPSMSNVIGQYKFGVCIDGIQDLNHAIDSIFNNYETFRNNAFECYENKYMFSNYFKKVIDKINNL